jgi:cyclopropane fatty-acyl-phospholipid synthase-like methyltransferase
MMGYFDDEKNVQEYIKMAEGFDGRDIIPILGRYLKKGSTVLELGMGPGKDLDILKMDYKVTGSDLSEVFIDLYRKNYPEADLLRLDAVTIETDREFDCIYSNKVLHHLSKKELEESFRRQWEVLNEGGVLFHTFWKGDKEEIMQGLLFVYYTTDGLKEVIGEGFSVLEIREYAEMDDDDDDSILIILKKY